MQGHSTGAYITALMKRAFVYVHFVPTDLLFEVLFVCGTSLAFMYSCLYDRRFVQKGLVARMSFSRRSEV